VNKEEIIEDLADSNAFVLYWNGELLGEKKLALAWRKKLSHKNTRQFASKLHLYFIHFQSPL